jgi:hypothetical protein
MDFRYTNRLAYCGFLTLTILVAGCASIAVSDDAIEQNTATTLGLQKGNFTISDRVDDGVKSGYTVQTKTGKKYSCYVTGTVSYMGRVVSDAVCNEIGGKQTKQAAPSNGTCNALLKAAGKC